MKLRKIVAGLFGVVGSVLLIGSAIACLGAVNQPEKPAPQSREVREFAKEFIDCLDTGDLTGVQQRIYGQPDLGLNREPESDVGKRLWKAYRDSISVEVSEYCTSQGMDICQNASVTALDLTATLARLDSRAAENLKQTLETAEDPSALLSADGSIPDSLRQQALTQALEQVLSEGKTVTRQVTVKLVKENGQWWAVPDGTLLAVLSAGLK